MLHETIEFQKDGLIYEFLLVFKAKGTINKMYD